MPGLGLPGNYVLAALPVLAVLWIRVRGVSWAEIRYGLGLHTGRGVVREALAGIVGYIAGLPLLAGAIARTFYLINRFGHPGSGGHPLQNMPVETPAQIAQIFLLAAVMAPVLEETMFRGALLHHCRRWLPWWAAALLVAVVFAVIHPQGWFGVPALTCIAIVLAGIREWRGSIIGPMVAHALHNGTLVLLMVMMNG